MDIYLDFEATQFKENIIAIGAYCSRGSFDCLVKPPKGDKVTNFISKLTGITSEMAKNALSIDEAFWDLHDWIFNITQDNIGGPTFFHVFGNMDKIFLKNTANFCKTEFVKTFIENLAESLIDDSRKVSQYFHMKNIGVYKALRFFEPDIPEQDHDPLNDAIALHNLMFHINFAKPLEECPFEQKSVVKEPPKRFHIIATKKGEEKKVFTLPDKAYNWAYAEVLKTNSQATRKTIHKNLKRALTHNSKYLGWKWRKEYIQKGRRKNE